MTLRPRGPHRSTVQRLKPVPRHKKAMADEQMHRAITDALLAGDLPPELAKAASLLSNVINLRCPKGPGDQPVAADAPADAADAADQMAGQGGGTLNASDRAARIPQAPAAQAPAPQVPAQSAPAAPPPASTPKVVILDQNGQPLPQSPDVQAAAPAPAPSPPPKKSGGLLGWLGGLFSGGH